MFNVICNRPNASEEISGIPFKRQEDGSVITDPPVTADVAEYFRDFDGYVVIDLDAPAPRPLGLAEPVVTGAGRPSKDQVDSWLKEIGELGGDAKRESYGKTRDITDTLTKLRADKAAAAEAVPEVVAEGADQAAEGADGGLLLAPVEPIVEPAPAAVEPETPAA